MERFSAPPVSAAGSTAGSAAGSSTGGRGRERTGLGEGRRRVIGIGEGEHPRGQSEGWHNCYCYGHSWLLYVVHLCTHRAQWST